MARATAPTAIWRSVEGGAGQKPTGTPVSRTRPGGVQTALINRRFAAAISRRVAARPEGRHNSVTMWLPPAIGDGYSMSFLLLAVGLMTAAVGLVTIGFGIPINAFSLGNTLIISGTIAVATGLILIGLALVLGQLRRIAETLRTKPMPRQAAAESVDAAAPYVEAPMAPAHFQPPMPEPMAIEPPPPRMPTPRAPEPRFPATASEPPGPLDWLRAKTKPGAASMPVAPPLPPMAEPPMVELTDEAPLSPRPPQRPAMPPMEPALESKVWSPNRDAGGRDPAAMEPRVAPRTEQPMPRAMPPVEPPKDKERFDLVWPD